LHFGIIFPTVLFFSPDFSTPQNKQVFSALVIGLVYRTNNRKPNISIVKTMISCRFSLKPIHINPLINVCFRTDGVFHGTSEKKMDEKKGYPT
jgi:hypothetical protein